MKVVRLEEAQTAHTSDDLRQLVGQFRRLGEAGPAYEIMSVEDDGAVHIEFVYNDEKLTCPLAEVLEDPIAETLP